MKTQNNKLNFKKNSIVELNEDSMNSVNGGSVSFILVSIIAASIAATIATRDTE